MTSTIDDDGRAFVLAPVGRGSVLSRIEADHSAYRVIEMSTAGTRIEHVIEQPAPTVDLAFTISDGSQLMVEFDPRPAPDQPSPAAGESMSVVFRY